MILLAAGTAPHLGGASDVDVPVGRILLALMLCVAIAGLAILLLRRRMGHDDLTRWLRRTRARDGAVEVVEVRRLNPHADIGLVRYDGHEFLLLLHAQRPAVLRERTLPAETSEP